MIIIGNWLLVYDYHWLSLIPSPQYEPPILQGPNDVEIPYIHHGFV